MDTSELHQLVQRAIDKHAPPQYQAQREALYRELSPLNAVQVRLDYLMEGIPTTDETFLTAMAQRKSPFQKQWKKLARMQKEFIEHWTTISDVPGFILGFIFSALADLKRAISDEDRERYWKNREQAEKLLQEVHDNPAVQHFSYYIVFVEPRKFICPHGRNQKHCIKIREKLEMRQVVLGDIHGQPLSQHWKVRLEALDRELKKMHVNPEAKPQDFCRFDRPALDVDTHQLSKAAHRPPDALQNELLQTVVGCLSKAGWSYKESCKFLAKVYVYCLGQPETDEPGTIPDRADALGRQWRRLREPKSQP